MDSDNKKLNDKVYEEYYEKIDNAYRGHGYISKCHSYVKKLLDINEDYLALLVKEYFGIKMIGH